MLHHTVFRGAATALVTPMTPEGVDYESFGRLIDWQIDQGISALVVCATTGEAPTLRDDEHCRALAFAVERAAGRVPIIAGTGSNDTSHAVMMTREACAMGADAILAVTPYYNRCTQTGLRLSYEAIADASTRPVILYNVPSRTGVNLEPATCLALAAHPNIAGVKEASGNLAQMMELFRLVGDRLAIYSGNDDQIVPLLALGGAGVISVVSNILPQKTEGLCRLWFDGQTRESTQLQLQLLPLIHALFSQVNPIPVKAALAYMGFCEDYLRLPLTPLEQLQRERLYACMAQWGLGNA